MYNPKLMLFAIAALFVSAGALTACTVAFESEQEGVFVCESDADCLDGYECDTAQKLCMEKKGNKPVESPPCDQDGNPPGDIDLDNDGYGTGDDRSNCPNPEPDCDDSNPNVHPNHPEICDGIYNGCDPDGTPDDFSCPGGSSLDCGPAPYNGVKYECINEVCVLKHNIQLGECKDIVASCNSAEKSFTYTVDEQEYHLTDEDGNLNGPIAQCG